MDLVKLFGDRSNVVGTVGRVTALLALTLSAVSCVEDDGADTDGSTDSTEQTDHPGDTSGSPEAMTTPSATSSTPATSHPMPALPPPISPINTTPATDPTTGPSETSSPVSPVFPMPGPMQTPEPTEPAGDADSGAGGSDGFPDFGQFGREAGAPGPTQPNQPNGPNGPNGPTEPNMSIDGGGAVTGETGKLIGITDAHNQKRMEVDADPPLPPLEWDDSIAALAQEWADHLAETCGFEHSHRDGLGENLAEFGTSQEGQNASTGADAVDGWYSEIECYTYGKFMDTDECTSDCDQYGGCGHYTQVVWRESQRVGCGVASCFDGRFYMDIYVCNYDPPGNFIGELPY
ncbi:MAG TPA: CAP domain-containing protein [Polyangiaceae bacterium]|nr:CAP domain-containing protein [Polyangiaceae bacterium]